MKGLAERTIVLLVIALIVMGVVVALLYFGLGPFRETMNYNSCKAQFWSFCANHRNDDGKYDCTDKPACGTTYKISCDATNCPIG